MGRTRWLGLLACLAWHLCQADDNVSICYGYGCAAEANIHYNAAQMRNLGWVMALASGPATERALLGQVIGRLYGWAGAQSPIRNDKGGNRADDGVHGRMDCIDHATSTTRLLKLLAERGYLRWHQVLAPVKRSRLMVLFEHYTAVIQDTSPRGEGEKYAVDSWFVNNGEPAVVMPLAEWERGGGPDVQ